MVLVRTLWPAPGINSTFSTWEHVICWLHLICVRTLKIHSSWVTLFRPSNLVGLILFFLDRRGFHCPSNQSINHAELMDKQPSTVRLHRLNFNMFVSLHIVACLYFENYHHSLVSSSLHRPHPFRLFFPFSSPSIPDDAFYATSNSTSCPE